MRVRAIILNENKIVLINRVKSDETYWVFPGGGVEAGESIYEALKRECFEELGVNVKINGLFRQRKYKGQIEYFYFCTIESGELGKGSGPEYQENELYEGSHHVVCIPIAKLQEINLKPIAIKNELYNLILHLNKLIIKRSVGYGAFNLSGHKYFYKIQDIYRVNKELRGYYQLRESYPVPNLFFHITHKNKGLILFEYEKTISYNRGLLVDYFAKNNKLDKKFIILLDLFGKIFLKTLRRGENDNADIFFRDRINARLNKFYDSKFINSYSNRDIKLNDEAIPLNLEFINKGIKKFFRGNWKTFVVLSQCDPNDLNIGMKPVIFDFIAGGYNPVMAEFATFFWYNLSQGNYLSLRYNKKYFKEHNKMYKKIDTVILNNKGNITHKILRIRKDAIDSYLNYIIKPILRKINRFDNWYLEFKNYLALKVLAVFDVSQMTHKDQLLCVAYLHYFYNNNPKTLHDFKLLFNKICKTR